jgi:hypothetical protein
MVLLSIDYHTIWNIISFGIGFLNKIKQNMQRHFYWNEYSLLNHVI